MRSAVAVRIFSAMGRPHVFLALVGTVILTGTSGCDRKSAKPKDPAPQATPALSMEKSEPPPWFVGASEARVPVEGLQSALSLDEAERRRASGKDPDPVAPVPGGTLDVRIEVDGEKRVSGTVRFEEISADVRGQVEGQSLRFRFRSSVLQGYGVAHKQDTAWKGQVSFSRVKGQDAALETKAYLGKLDLPLPQQKATP